MPASRTASASNAARRRNSIAALPHSATTTGCSLCNGVKDREHAVADPVGAAARPARAADHREVHRVRAVDGARRRANRGRRASAVRIRLATRGAGALVRIRRRAFEVRDLTVPELVGWCNELERRGMPDSLELLHFHLGSQIAEIQVLKRAVKEDDAGVRRTASSAACRCATSTSAAASACNYGAGYGVDEDGINYSLQEYANAVVFCRARRSATTREVPHPVLVSESGRAITAHHSVLIVPVLGAYGKDRRGRVERTVAEADDGPCSDMLAGARRSAASAATTSGSCSRLITTHRRRAPRPITVFRLGYLALEQLRHASKRLYWGACRRDPRAPARTRRRTAAARQLQNSRSG